MRKVKIRLGKQTEEGYKYSTSLDLGKDLWDQVKNFREEERIREALNKRVSVILGTIAKFQGRDKRDNISYYYTLGKDLQFIDKPPFKKVEPHSLFRLIYEHCREILPHISDPKVVAKHIAAMFYLGKVGRKDLDKATWLQWYELTKFKKLFGNKNFYRKILSAIRGKRTSGPQLRLLINKELGRIKIERRK